MGLVTNKAPETKPAAPKVEATPAPAHVASEISSISKKITLKYATGFSFSITVEGEQLTVEACIGPKQVFVMDELPKSFINDLRNMLQES